MKKTTKLTKPYWDMTTEELAEATKEFDKPIPLSKTRPLTKQERALFERMRKGPHRSIYISRDASGVWVRLDPDVHRRAVRYAAEQKVPLAEVIDRSLKVLLTIVEPPAGRQRPAI